jgi:hypothetical protein
MVRRLPKVAVQEKKATLGGTLAFQTLFQGNDPGAEGLKQQLYSLTMKPFVGVGL